MVGESYYKRRKTKGTRVTNSLFVRSNVVYPRIYPAFHFAEPANLHEILEFRYKRGEGLCNSYGKQQQQAAVAHIGQKDYDVCEEKLLPAKLNLTVL